MVKGHLNDRSAALKSKTLADLRRIPLDDIAECGAKLC
jgi:hypothetical protein